MRTRTIAEVLPLACVSMLMLGGGVVVSSANARAQNDGQNSRQIFAEEFTRARPIKPPTASSTASKSRTGRASQKTKAKPRYKRVSQSSTAATVSVIPTTAAKLGVTIWRLRPAKASDDGARLLVQENAKETEWTPERIAATTELRVEDRVRLSIESPREGYLYVIDRERYADGSMGNPYLIFPTLKTNGGDNRVYPGRLIDIPAETDKIPFFTLKPDPGAGRKDQVGEVLTIIVTTQPLVNIQVPKDLVQLAKSQVDKWEKDWGARVEQYDLEGGAGQTWSKEEKEASSEGTGRYLVQEDPSPQTVFLVEGKDNKVLLVTVPLTYRR